MTVDAPVAISTLCLQDLQDRLAHSEAATASYATEHYDVVWLKGETEGLKELNQFLQDQLTEQAELLQLQSEELQELREQLDRCAGMVGTGVLVGRHLFLRAAVLTGWDGLCR